MVQPATPVIRIPPDSSGKRIGHRSVVEVYFSTLTGTLAVGDVIIGDTSDATGTIVYVEENGGSGRIDVLLAEASPTDFTAGELILNVATPQATVTSSYPIYYQKNLIASGANPQNVARVDSAGAIYVRNTEGVGNYDAFGNVSTASLTQLAAYGFAYNTMPNSFEDEATLGSSIVHHPEYAGVLMSCPTTSGALVSRTTHLYHKYQPGFGQTIHMTLAAGDSGKANVVRQWGYFDGYDGVFFELSGTTFNVVLRSSTSGSVVETRVPQNQWSDDRGDGTGGALNLSGVDLDLITNRIWWIDLQWLGAGRVRFGTYGPAGRVVLHEIIQGTTLYLPYMRTGTLPVQIRQYNSGTSASTSELKFFCASVTTSGNLSPVRKVFGQTTVPSKSVDGYTFSPIFSVRSKRLFGGVDNRVVIIPSDLGAYSSSAPVLLQITKNPTLSGDTWLSDGGTHTSLEGDTGATSASGGQILFSKMVGGNDTCSFDIAGVNEYVSASKLHRHANISEYDFFTISARCVNPGDTSAVSIVFNWEEIY